MYLCYYYIVKYAFSENPLSLYILRAIRKMFSFKFRKYTKDTCCSYNVYYILVEKITYLKLPASSFYPSSCESMLCNNFVLRNFIRRWKKFKLIQISHKMPVCGFQNVKFCMSQTHFREVFIFLAHVIIFSFTIHSSIFHFAA